MEEIVVVEVEASFEVRTPDSVKTHLLQTKVVLQIAGVASSLAFKAMAVFKQEELEYGLLKVVDASYSQYGLSFHSNLK